MVAPPTVIRSIAVVGERAAKVAGGECRHTLGNAQFDGSGVEGSSGVAHILQLIGLLTGKR